MKSYQNKPQRRWFKKKKKDCCPSCFLPQIVTTAVWRYNTQMWLFKGLLTVFGPHNLRICGPAWFLIALKVCTFNDLCLTRLKINLWVCLSQSMWNNRAAVMWHFGWVSSSKKPAFCALPQIPKGISACQVSSDMTGRRWASGESQQTQDGLHKMKGSQRTLNSVCAPHYAGNHEEMWDKKRIKGTLFLSMKPSDAHAWTFDF